MLFRKKITPSCTYCAFGTGLDNGQILCTKKGPVETRDKCFSFRYDPLKRMPTKAKALDFSKYDEDDFTLYLPEVINGYKLQQKNH